ncbi:hypothetical protein RRG08_024850 [Elysia crispata]|uniref:Uncharacterized protein n=1 Tax=Elysia crispata TaxID=231223 RepID=A0AAE0YJ01_9GAST|nr:hypothetical protein RRG08_024850 [Elysia crispata]
MELSRRDDSAGLSTSGRMQTTQNKARDATRRLRKSLTIEHHLANYIVLVHPETVDRHHICLCHTVTTMMRRRASVTTGKQHKCATGLFTSRDPLQSPITAPESVSYRHDNDEEDDVCDDQETT